MKKNTKKRLAFLLAICMIFTSFYVPVDYVYAAETDQSEKQQAEGNEIEDVQVVEPEEITQEVSTDPVEIPEEYLDFNEAQNLQNINLVSDAEEEQNRQEIPEEYKTIPVIGNPEAKVEDEIMPELNTEAPEISEDDVIVPTLVPDMEETEKDVAVDLAAVEADETDIDINSVSENNGIKTFEVGEIVSGECLVPGNSDPDYYYFTVPESGEYVINTWGDTGVYCSLEYQEDDTWYYFSQYGNGWSNNEGNNADSVSLSAGTSYRLYCYNYNYQLTYRFMVSKAVELADNTETAITTTGYVNADFDEPHLAQLSINSENGKTYHVRVNDTEIMPSSDGNYHFIAKAEQFIIWKDDNEADTITVSFDSAAIPEVAFDNGSSHIEETVSLISYNVKDYDNKKKQGFVKFTPQETGYYVIGEKNGQNNYPSYFGVYTTDDKILYSVGDGSYYKRVCKELEAGKTYYISVGLYQYSEVPISDSFTMTFDYAKEQAVTLGDNVSFQTAGERYVVAELNTTDVGAYHIKVDGATKDYEIGETNTFRDNAINGGNLCLANGSETDILVTSVNWDNDGNDKNISLLLTTSDNSQVLDDFTLSVTKSNCEMKLDNDGIGKKEITLDPLSDQIVSFTPEEDGNYVLCTEKKYNNQYATVYLYEKNSNVNYMYNNQSSGSYDNIQMINELTAGNTYYYYIRMPYETADKETVDLVLYQEAKAIDVTDTKTATTDIRKSSSFKITIPEAGFYKLGVTGKDESYFLNISEPDSDNFNTQRNFVYNDIPRVFQFAKAGTYTVWVTKELMSEETDTITFSYETATLEKIEKTKEETDLDIIYTDGAWIEFTPSETGWYDLTTESGEGVSCDLSVLSLDKTSIDYKTWLSPSMDYSIGEQTEDGWCYKHTTQFCYKLEGGRTYYYRMYFWGEYTGKLKISMYPEGSTVTVSDDETQTLESDERLVRIKTNLEGETLCRLVNADGYQMNFSVKDITNGTEEEWIQGSPVILSSGEREYLLCKPEGTMDVSCMNQSMTLSKTLPLSFKNDNPLWVKYVPEQSGYYAITSDNCWCWANVYKRGEESYNKNRLESVGYVETTSGKYVLTAWLEEGKTYFYQFYNDDYDQEECNITLSLLQESEDTFKVGENKISGGEIWLTNNAVGEAGYYKISVKDATAPVYIRWSNRNTNGWYSYSITEIPTEGVIVYLGGIKTNIANTKVEIIRPNVVDKEDTIVVDKIPTVEKNLVLNQTMEEEAQETVKEYHFTPAESGSYTFSMQSNELSGKFRPNIKVVRADNGEQIEYSKRDREAMRGDFTFNYNLSYSLEAGTEYVFNLNCFNSYQVTMIPVEMKYVYDYDHYAAFIASGGTINVLDSYDDITSDMQQDCDNGLSTYDSCGDKIIYVSAKNFKDPTDTWLLYPWDGTRLGWTYRSSCADQYFYAENGKLTFDDLKDTITGWQLVYTVADMYTTTYDKPMEFSKVSMTDKIGAEQDIILVKYMPQTVLAQEITLNGLTVMKVGQNAKVSAKTDTKNSYRITNPNVVFSSSDPSVITVDKDGNVVAKKAGQADVICKSADGNATAKLTVSVKQDVVYVEKVTVQGANEVYVGDSITLSAATDTNGKGNPTISGVNWSSSDNSIATVDENGVVTGLREGTVAITASSKDGHASASKMIQVKPVIASKIALNESKILMKKGTSYTWLEVKFTPENTTDKGITWESSNSKVATVTTGGVIKAKAVGKATITAKTKNGLTDSVTVTVTASEIKVKKLSLDKKMQATVGQKIALEPEFTPVNATNKKLDWSSSDETVATVNSKGVVTIKDAGKVTITAKAKDGSGKTAKCKITVKNPDTPKITSVESTKAKTAEVKWNAVEDVDGYIIYASTSKNGEYKKVAKVKGGDKTSYTVKKLSSKTNYYFKIVSYAKAGKKEIYSKTSKVVKEKIK